MTDNVNHPSHYNSHPSGVECITITEHMTFNVGNAVKYLWRAGLKDRPAPIDLANVPKNITGVKQLMDAAAMTHIKHIEDLNKARWYIDRELKRLTTTKGE